MEDVFHRVFDGVPSLSAALDANDVSPKVQSHLKRVYGIMSLMLFSTSIGSAFYLSNPFAVSSFLTTIATFGALFLLVSSTDKRVTPFRLGLSCFFGLAQGYSIGSLVDVALRVDPAIVPIALSSTIVVFACFGLSAALSPRRSYFYLGGVLSSAVSVLFWMRLASYFFGGAQTMLSIDVYVGLLIFVAYVVFDTQLVIERASAGVKDPVGDAITFYLDFVNIFVRLLIVLIKQREKKQKDKRRKNR